MKRFTLRQLLAIVLSLNIITALAVSDSGQYAAEYAGHKLGYTLSRARGSERKTERLFFNQFDKGNKSGLTETR